MQDIRSIPISAVTLGLENRMRPLNAEAAASLIPSLQESGQQVPIIVREVEPGTFKLLAGRHRLWAAKQLGWTTIRADVRTGTGTAEQVLQDDRRIEIIENLRRAELGAILRCEHLIEDRAVRLAADDTKRIAEVEARAADERRQGGKISAATRKALHDARRAAATEPAKRSYGRYTREIAEVTKRSRRVVRRELRLAYALRDASLAFGFDPRRLIGSPADRFDQIEKLVRFAEDEELGLALRNEVIENEIQLFERRYTSADFGRGHRAAKQQQPLVYDKDAQAENYAAVLRFVRRAAGLLEKAAEEARQRGMHISAGSIRNARIPIQALCDGLALSFQGSAKKPALPLDKILREQERRAQPDQIV